MFIKILGKRIFYDYIGIGAPLILMHGNGETHRLFNCVLEDLAKKNTVYALDTIGHGKSKRDDGKWSYEEMSDILLEFIKVLEIKKPFFFGFSDGGIIGLISASKQPNVFEKIMVCGANTNPLALKRHFRMNLKLQYFFKKSNNIEQMLTQPHISDKMLKNISVPTTVVVGSKDLIKASDTKFIADNLVNSKTVILENENHGSYIYNPSKLLSLIQNHLLN